MLDALVAGTTDPQVLAELARGRLRAKLPALREALEGRFDRMHALWIGAILAHIDFLDEQIAGLTEAIGEQIAPFAKAVELLCTITGVQRRTAETIIAEIGVDMSIFPSAKHLASLGRPMPRQPPVRRQAPLGQDPQRLEVARLGARRSRAGRDPLQAQLPRRAIRPPTPAARPQEGARRRQALDHRRLLAHAHHRRALQRPRRRLLRHAATPRRPPSASSPSSNASATSSRCRRPAPRRAQTYFPVSCPRRRSRRPAAGEKWWRIAGLSVDVAFSEAPWMIRR